MLGPSAAFFQLWPMAAPRQPWSALTEGLYAHMGAYRVAHSNADGGRWMLPDEAVCLDGAALRLVATDSEASLVSGMTSLTAIIGPTIMLSSDTKTDQTQLPVSISLELTFVLSLKLRFEAGFPVRTRPLVSEWTPGMQE